MSEMRVAVSTSEFIDESDGRPKVGPDPVPGTRPAIATQDHFRILAEGEGGATTTVLYHEGQHVPVGHRDLPAVAARFDTEAGVWVPDVAAPVTVPSVPVKTEPAAKAARR